MILPIAALCAATPSGSEPWNVVTDMSASAPHSTHLWANASACRVGHAPVAAMVRARPAVRLDGKLCELCDFVFAQAEVLAVARCQQDDAAAASNADFDDVVHAVPVDVSI